jgi:hypothetical protein
MPGGGRFAIENNPPAITSIRIGETMNRIFLLLAVMQFQVHSTDYASATAQFCAR